MDVDRRVQDEVDVPDTVYRGETPPVPVPLPSDIMMTKLVPDG